MITVVIPVRMASTRFPDKPLAMIAGLPMVEHVRRRAQLAHGVDSVVVATCDESIRKAVEFFGGSVVMTSDAHQRGTDRVCEAMGSLKDEVVVMVQGDEPMLIPDTISQLITPLRAAASLLTANLLSTLEASDLPNADVVKAVCDQSGNVIYLTRSPVPTFRRESVVPVHKQTGIIAFRTEFLRRMVAMPETPLEHAESVDMLRALENGVRIAGVLTPHNTIGVDRPADVALVEAALRDDPTQRALHRQVMDRKAR
ncbi:MAG: 3-deoxy-manno-octulosonate cytidylyltransferase [Gemmatimonadetes bacterium]|nr:3-deoxy-manno-octulosonate cytidylyltransferase [Gemmatimonadota bacterium]